VATVLAGAAVAAIEVSGTAASSVTATAANATSSWVHGSITLAALALPGVMLSVTPTAYAESAPTEGLIAFKLQAYSDGQPGLDRIKVVSPSLYLLAPIAGSWLIESTLVHDNISGASPRWHTNISGASQMRDRRTAADVKVSRYFDRWSVGVRASTSDENDYRSNAGAFEARMSSADNNTTWVVGAGLSRDTINPVNELVTNEKRRVTEVMVGVTQAWTKNDLLQMNLSHVSGRGYFSDPYKLADERPRSRHQTIALLRWNHFFERGDTTLRSSYRYYNDSFGVHAHTLHAEWVKPINDRFTITPSARYYTQQAARFYFDPVYDPVIGEPFPAGNPRYYSADARLSSYSAVTLGAKLEWRIDSLWSADIKYERYEQRGAWRLGGSGSTGLAPFRAQFGQIGVSRRF
jgi:hypothetical protein